MSHKQLDYLKRCRIAALWEAGHKQCDIATAIDVHPSTVSRELKRNITFVRTKFGYWAYKPSYAQFNADENHRIKPKKVKLTENAKAFITEKIMEEWSPDQISGYAKRHNLFSLGKEWIYQFVLKDKKDGGKLYMHLRHKHKKYRKRYGSPKRQGAIRNRRLIDDRPAIVDAKQRLGSCDAPTINYC
jgi:transposase, IS30 family